MDDEGEDVDDDEDDDDGDESDECCMNAGMTPAFAPTVDAAVATAADGDVGVDDMIGLSNVELTLRMGDIDELVGDDMGGDDNEITLLA